jgi:hypothetical protein
MANSFGSNERPSRTSGRGVATLYQGSMTIVINVSMMAMARRRMPLWRAA